MKIDKDSHKQCLKPIIMQILKKELQKKKKIVEKNFQSTIMKTEKCEKHVEHIFVWKTM